MTKKILLVDDESDITFTIKDILEDAGFEVDAFNDPTIALKSYRINFYDLVILDIKMPISIPFNITPRVGRREWDSNPITNLVDII